MGAGASGVAALCRSPDGRGDPSETDHPGMERLDRSAPETRRGVTIPDPEGMRREGDRKLRAKPPLDGGGTALEEGMDRFAVAVVGGDGLRGEEGRAEGAA